MAKEQVVHLTLPATFPASGRTRAGVTVPAGGAGVVAKVTPDQLKALEADPEIQVRTKNVPKEREVSDFTGSAAGAPEDAISPFATDRGIGNAPGEGTTDYSDKLLKGRAAARASSEAKTGEEAERLGEEAKAEVDAGLETAREEQKAEEADQPSVGEQINDPEAAANAQETPQEDKPSRSRRSNNS